MAETPQSQRMYAQVAQNFEKSEALFGPQAKALSYSAIAQNFKA
jgi:hypothetical protein